VGKSRELTKARAFLQSLRDDLPDRFAAARTCGEVWRWVDEQIIAAGYDNIHKKYPFSVLGHRVHRSLPSRFPGKLWHFGWQSYWSFFSRGVLSQVLNETHEGS